MSTTDPYAERVLDATYELVNRYGVRRTSMADVVRASGVSKATLFRRFPSKAELLNAIMVREVTRFLAQLQERVASLEDPVERLVETVVFFVEVAPEHELLRALIETDPETTLPLLTVDSAPILAFGQEYMRAELTRVQESGRELTASPEICAELLTRISHSFLVQPASRFPLDDADAIRKLARATLVRMVLRK
ncbi:MAG: TetR/AcrR family transcriptional regulator [Solirubrobacteraceae bacterium]|nr:TetR/AcrR family transcriptional regulator [Solirubrobacteraceae bacterium]